MINFINRLKAISMGDPCGRPNQDKSCICPNQGEYKIRPYKITIQLQSKSSPDRALICPSFL